MAGTLPRLAINRPSTIAVLALAAAGTAAI
jgi:hypothetical protein